MAFETINLGTQPAGTGGDTARSAFEKTNRNFLAAEVLSAAMSQAQFEAIRAQNNEEFAASDFVHKGKHYNNGTTYIAINDGLWTVTDSANTLVLGKHDTPTPAGSSKTNYAVLNLAGVIFNIATIGTTGNQCNIKFTQAPDGKTTYNKSTGVITTHATVTAAFNAQAADPTNVEVVTDRVDMWGFEAWLEEVSTTNPYVYPNGLIQSQATTMDGIATSASARPVTYYAVFDGDTGSKGKGLNFFTLTDAQKKKVLANPKNNLYYLDDGRLVQWRLRQRTFAGAGNGDWSAIDSSVSNSYGLLPSTVAGSQLYRPQGNGDLPYTSTAYWCPASQKGVKVNWGWPNHIDVGIYLASRGNNGVAVNSVNGECYFLVCGTVNRLNQGAYHPSFNPSGAGRLNASNLVGTGAFWYSSSVINPSSTVECFKILSANVDSTTAGVCNGTGAIGGYAVSGRPDGRYYDAIYAEGQGGVCRDMRYSAYGVDTVDFAEADQRVKNGTYRGFEKLAFTEIKPIPFSSEGESNTLWYIRPTKWVAGTKLLYPKIGDTVWVRDASGVVSFVGVSNIVEDANGFTATLSVPKRRGANSRIIFTIESRASVGGSFLQTDVIGNPVNILATPQLANGWQGSWIPVIPDGTSKTYSYTRKALSFAYNYTYTTDNGASWIMPGNMSALNPSNVSNSHFIAHGSSTVLVLNYQAFARQTENAVNAVVYGENAGVGGVIATSDSFLPEQNRGVLLKESLTGGKRGISGYTNGAVQGLNLTQFTLVSDKLLSGRSAYDSVHPPILIDGNTSVDAVKALNYNVNINQQAFIQYAYTELKHNGTNWGDDSKITIVDNQSAKTDLNGNTVLVGTAKLREPIGWIKNKV